MKIVLPLLALVCALAAGCAAKTHYTELQGGGVLLFLNQPEARSVQIVTSRTGYAPEPAVRNKDGAWIASAPAHEPFDYFFLVDGEPFTPPCALSRPDDFGGRTCIYDPAP